MDEGAIKFDCRWQRGPPPSAIEVAELCRWRDRLHALGSIGYDPAHAVGYGNLSVRAEGDEVLISGTQTGGLAPFGPEHVTRIVAHDIASNQVTCVGPVEASSEALTHLALYALGPAVGAVMHVHDAALWRGLRDVAPTTDAGVAYGTPAMAREIERLARQHPEARVLVMAGHPDGIIAYGADCQEAGTALLAEADRGR